MDNYNYVGKSILREDSYNRACGRTKYIADMDRQNMLYSQLVLAEEFNRKVTIDTSQALAINGVEAIFTFIDIPKVKYNSNHWYSGLESPEDEYLLTDKPLFEGDRIALVVGTSMDVVEKAVRNLRISYGEELSQPSILSINDPKASIAIEKSFSCGDFNTIAKQSDYLVSDTGTTPKAHHGAIEPHGCLAEIDEQNNLLVYSPCQSVFQCQYHISKILGIPMGKVRVIKAHMGGILWREMPACFRTNLCLCSL